MKSAQRILLTGATGFVGRLLALRLKRDRHQVVAWVRSASRARSVLGADTDLLELAAGDDALVAELSRCDAVIHLAGAPLLAGRWTAARKAELAESRVALTRRMVAAIERSAPRPRALISASAVGWYGARGDERLDETSLPGTGFLADLCQAWESAAFRAREHGVRVACIRIGLVLGSEGGVLAKLRPLFELGLGGRLGDGRQWMSWIHVEDLLELLTRAAWDERFEGVFDGTAPGAVTNRDFTRCLASALNRRAFLPAPRFALRAALGEAADALLTGQRVEPRRALELGFEHRFATLDDALKDILDTTSACELGAAASPPTSDYLAARRPRFALAQRTRIEAPLERVFEFFSKPENLGAITPPSMAFEIRTPRPIVMRAGATIDYAIRIGPFPLQWRTQIEEWQPNQRFVDVQMRGPYQCWWHEHRFAPDGDATWMEDRVLFAPPLGALGALLGRVFISSRLRAIFAYRARVIRLRFGERAFLDAAEHEIGPRTRSRPWAGALKASRN